MHSESLFERSKKVTPGGVHSPVRAFRGVGGTPRFIKEAQGARMTDVDGKTYVDFCMGWGPMILGHRDPEIFESVQSALSRGWNYGACDETSLELAEWISREIPWAEKVRFVNTGTEAVMSAIRVARAATGRDLILKMDGCYHGHADGMLVRAGSGLAEMSSPDSAGVSRAVASETRVVPLDDLSKVQAEFDLHGKSIAAMIVEGVPANNGLLIQTDDYLKNLSAIAKKYGALLIMDEVITGFRLGLKGASDFYGVTPDLVTFGKIIGGGFPVGAYAGRADLMDLVAPQGGVYQAGTLSANPISMTAGLATLRKLKRLNPYRDLETKTSQFADRLEKHLSKVQSEPVHVQRLSSMFWPVFGSKNGEIVRSIASIPPVQKAAYATVFHASLERGFYFAPSAFEVGFMSTAHTAEDLEI